MIPKQREDGVLYQHELYPGFTEHVTAIEIEGVRFERVIRCKECANFKQATNFCDTLYEIVSQDGFCSRAVGL